jgi:serine/threonine protein kinase
VIFDADPTRVRLADFGIARFNDTTRMTATGQWIGTAAYLAPEQLLGEVGPAADVYALGLVVLECLAGIRCYPGTAVETTMARLHRPPDIPANLPSWLGHTLEAMTARDPNRRPPAAAVADAFRCQSVDPVLATTTEADVAPRIAHRQAARPPWDARRGRRPLLLAFCAGALTSAAALALSLTIWPFGGSAQATEPQTPSHTTSTTIPTTMSEVTHG